MAYAKAAEYVDGWLLDKRGASCSLPASLLGQTTHSPCPYLAGSASAPRQEDCDVAYTSPSVIYQQILGTKGFTPRQLLDANIAYASWLEYSRDLASAGNPSPERACHCGFGLIRPAIRTQHLRLEESAGSPSENVLRALTEYATFRARTGRWNAALPILISILQARRSLPPPAPKAIELAKSNPLEDPFSKLWRVLKRAVAPPDYPPPPDDGRSPPTFTTPKNGARRQRCTWISERRRYTPPISTVAKRDSAWTRDAVDLAEEAATSLTRPGRTTRAGHGRPGRECPATGLGNWASMGRTPGAGGGGEAGGQSPKTAEVACRCGRGGGGGGGGGGRAARPKTLTDGRAEGKVDSRKGTEAEGPIGRTWNHPRHGHLPSSRYRMMYYRSLLRGARKWMLRGSLLLRRQTGRYQSLVP